MLDHRGSQDVGRLNIRGRLVQASAIFSGSPTKGSELALDGCLQLHSSFGGVASSGGMMLGSRAAEMGRFFRGALAEVVVFPFPLNSSSAALMASYFRAAWPALQPLPPGSRACQPRQGLGFDISQAYAISRFLNAIVSRPGQASLAMPVKFNGGSWLNARPNVTEGGQGIFAGGPDDRDWGPSNWWQNTRLPHGPQLADGDWAEQDALFAYYGRMVPFLTARSLAQFNASGSAGFWMTETATTFGSYTQPDYGSCGNFGPRPAGLPQRLGANPYVLLDYYGDGPMAELSLMMLDRYLYDQDGNALQQRLLMLPAAFSSAAQRSQWAELLAHMPALPLEASSGLLAPAAAHGPKSHNSESCGLYSIHPARSFSVGVNLTRPGGVNLSLAASRGNWRRWGSGAQPVGARQCAPVLLACITPCRLHSTLCSSATACQCH
jgi:hypothetical protein